MFSISESEPAVFSVKNRRIRPSHLLLAVMLAAYALRLLLIVNGGQFYFPDEYRYKRAIAAADHLYQGRFTDAFNDLLRYKNHHGVAAATVLPAIFHRIIHGLNHDDDLRFSSPFETPPKDFRIAALIFAMPSVLSMGMIYLIARQAGAGEAEALLSAFLLAAANTFYIYSKHFFSYDFSMLLGLAALYFVVRLPAARDADALRIGLLSFLMFWVYNGYVIFMIAIGLIYSIYLAQSPRQIIKRIIGMAGGALLFFIPLVVLNRMILNEDAVSQMLGFSGQRTQGDFSQGAVFPLLYFRDAEGLIALVWILGLALAGWQIWRQPASLRRQRGMLWAAFLVVLHTLLSLLSTDLQHFVVFGRTARLLAPFIVMLCAYGLTPWLLRYGAKAVGLFAAAVSILAAANFIPAIQQQYPLEIAWQVYQEYDDVSFETTFSPPSYARKLSLPGAPGARYKLLNASLYYPITEMEATPEGEVILEIAHPFSSKAWQYDGITAAMREIINRNGVKIWLIDTQAAAN